VAEAVRTIERHGADALTLRGVGASLGVSRTALYRHYADKSALLEAVSKEGFRLFRTALADAWERAGRGGPGFAAMGEAYVHFALDHPSHYRVMFSGLEKAGLCDPEHEAEGAAAFQVLVNSLLELQRDGVVRAGEDIGQLARYIWAVVHGVAMLALDGRLQGRADAEQLARYSIARIQDGMRAPETAA
jgi:AcrR family transcriptional regulator